MKILIKLIGSKSFRNLRVIPYMTVFRDIPYKKPPISKGGLCGLSITRYQKLMAQPMGSWFWENFPVEPIKI
jgi:hypothetical protein